MPTAPLLDLPPQTRLRSGAAARLAGLPATTLRVWERRYGVVSAPKSATGQRLYTPLDVQRLMLLKRLTDRGHAIGTVATLPLEALLALANAPADERDRAEFSPPLTSRLVLVGRALAQRLATQRWREGRIVVLERLDDLESDASGAAASRADGGPAGAMVIVHLPSLQPADAQRILDLARAQASRWVVVYRFAAQQVLASLRGAGVELIREPLETRALARHLDHALAALTPGQPWPAAPRRFSDADLSELAQLPTSVLCECPRHLAEIVAQLAGFERYSAECGVRSPQDAALHRKLHALTAAARARFEEALAELAAAEGYVPRSSVRAG